MNRADEFIRIYNELDREMRKELKTDTRISHMKALDILANKNDLISQNIDDLKQYARLRNCIIHDTPSGTSDPIALPLPEVVERYQMILKRFKNPLTVYDICTHRPQMLVTSPHGLALNIMQVMEKLLISRVPVLENEKVIGVFNGNVLIYYLAKAQDCFISCETKIDDFSEFIKLDAQRKEEYDFVPPSLNVYDAKKYFKTKNKNNHKLVALFITSNGTNQGKLLGMLTEWDLFNKIDIK